MHILVTGCAGFIGAAVSRILIDRGHTVYGIDNLNHAYDLVLKWKRLESLRPLDGFEFAQMDITDGQTTGATFARQRFDAVINLAAHAGVRQSADAPQQFYNSNVVGTINLLENCQRYGVDRFVLASSSSVYGDSEGPFSEASRTEAPISPYAASKKAAEDICYTYHHLYGIDTTVLRFFSVYGPAGRPDMSVFRFIRDVVEGRKLTVFGDGRQSRDFTYIDDIASGVAAAVEKTGGFNIINLGAGNTVTLCEMISEIENAAQMPAVVRFTDPDPLDVRATWADISAAKKLLDWSPKVTLGEGIRETVCWYLENRAWARDLRSRPSVNESSSGPAGWLEEAAIAIAD